MIKISFPISFQKKDRTKFNLGKPEILKMNLVSYLNINSSISGINVIKCIIKKSGFSFLKILCNFIKKRCLIDWTCKSLKAILYLPQRGKY